ncbi:MAG: hypothetical protein H0W74_12935 [Sphingosinicella sp.]|nr:hypothetical protein [Sphingosinicella sp.]
MKTTFILMAAAAGIAGLAGMASAQSGSSDRVKKVIVFGNDPCPAGSNGEIVVCARRPDNDRYRIPEEFRGEGRAESESWAARAESLETVGATGIQSCSTVGPGGFTGCWAEMMRQAKRDRRRNPQP